MPLSAAQIQQFKIDGYLLLRSALQPQLCQQLRELTEQALTAREAPIELEAEVQYPGSPKSTDDPGGETIRRLLLAYQRHPAFAAIAGLPLTTGGIRQILQSEQLWMNPNHHNCIMTKHPQFSSETLWHRDTRYWNFSDKYLINAWFALGEEQEANGAMKILPGSHRWDVQDEALDAAQFLKLEHPDNLDRLATQRTVALNAGDALLFSAHCFHAAGKNVTDRPKYSLVFTYHGETTKALPGTHSANLPEIEIGQ